MQTSTHNQHKEVGMKRTASILAILSATFILGCQENTITDPIAAVGSADRQLSKAQPGNSLILEAVLLEPGNFINSFIVVTGQVGYTATVVALDPVPPNPQYAVRLTLTADALLRPYYSNYPVWSISGASEDWVMIPDSGTTSLTKRYRIEGRNDGLWLNLRFRITLASVELSNMWLELPRVVRTDDQQ
jgi:hypothetical protein